MKFDNNNRGEKRDKNRRKKRRRNKQRREGAMQSEQANGGHWSDSEGKNAAVIARDIKEGWQKPRWPTELTIEELVAKDQLKLTGKEIAVKQTMIGMENSEPSVQPRHIANFISMEGQNQKDQQGEKPQGDVNVQVNVDARGHEPATLDELQGALGILQQCRPGEDNGAD